jgi:hypothetical protein
MTQHANSNGKSSEKKRPVQEIRLGRIRAAIWVNETENGVRHNVTISRLYRDEQQGQWKDSTSFGRDDLPLVAKVADQAHLWIFQAQARAAQAGEAGLETSVAAGDESQAVPVGAGVGGDIPF